MPRTITNAIASPASHRWRPTLLEASASRARACLYGFVAVAMLWAFTLSAAVAFAQEPMPRRWDQQTAGTLLGYIEQIDSHGLDPADYAPVELEQALVSGDAARLERQATASFARVAADLAIGHVKQGRRGRYFIASDTIEPARMARLIDTAIVFGSVAHVLEALAPQNREYAALRAALRRLEPGQDEERRKVEVSLERWRWLPRDLGNRHLLVNIPEYRLRLLEDDREIAAHRVIVGKLRTPTPQFSAQVTAVILNPSWHVPQSIIAESVGRVVRNSPQVARARGYVWNYLGGGLQVTQQPGPQNALGQMKLEMTNPLSVYIHDTPSKDLFERDVRTFSHGCIRTELPFDLAAVLLQDAGWTRSQIDGGVSARQTRRVPLTNAVPVFVVYMTAVVETDGTVRFLDDPYQLDGAIAAQLD
jgi:murein L,D-transpeptidase YcbB/YkuD